MRKILACAPVLAIALGRSPSRHEPRVFASACRVSDSATDFEITYWQGVMRSANPHDSVLVRHASLLYVADSAFAVVTDSTTCAEALAAHNVDAGYLSTELSSPSAATVYAIRIGTRYVTWNPDFPSGEYVAHSVWDSSFVSLSGYYH